MNELRSAILIKRYKRFLADVRLDDGKVLTVHCPNTGSMKNCQEPRSRVWYSTSENPRRKYLHTWELVETSAGHLININAASANKLVQIAIENSQISELAGYTNVQPEVRYGKEHSRIDLLLSGRTEEPMSRCYIEIKSVTLLDEAEGPGVGLFPDAVSERGARHLRELEYVTKQGDRAVLFYCIQNTGIKQVQPADGIDPQYGRALRQAMAAGVEVIAYATNITPDRTKLDCRLPVICP